jgi:site-specific DNA recombinase
VPARTLKDELLALEQRQDQLETELAAAPDEAFELIRSLIDKVVVTPTEGEMHIDLHGELAGILGLCREGRRGGGFDAETVAQIKVVAGAGFEPATFRL